MKPNPVTNLWPIGYIATHAGTTVQEIERVADAMGFEPIFWLVGVAYYNLTQGVLMTEALENERSAKRQTEAASRN